ncbi:MAG: phosphoribosylamine--glycine ligase [Treponema sp.]|jgi:phosphoribosylamine--glycine ligase|nr:phosphoribosylamine--glycine ligase [Treponema sp.]
MKVLVIGSGGREHAVAWKLAMSPKIKKVFVAPGNGGTACETKCENVCGDVVPETEAGQAVLSDFAEKAGVAFSVVGPEAPLAAGIVTAFRGRSLAVVGPDKTAARLESSKSFSKAFMAKYGVRTAGGRRFTCCKGESAGSGAGFEDAVRYVKAYFALNKRPIVIKADGLAAGKGVVITDHFSEAEACLRSFMQDGIMGEAGRTVVIEDFLRGREVSVLAAVSVQNGEGVIAPFISARDHKPRFDGGKGPNTGGMGAIAPVPDFTDAVQEDFRTSILEPTLKGLKAEYFDYRGFIFFGLMVHEERCYLLEYNVRLGDPETQAVLPLLDADFADVCGAILDGKLAGMRLAWKHGAVCAPVAVAGGYPGSYRKGDHIAVNGGELPPDTKIFVAGARLQGEKLLTSGGRVLTVSAYGSNAESAGRSAYHALEAVRFDGMGYRKDIGTV